MHTVSVAAIHLLGKKAYKQNKMVAFSSVADAINSFSGNVSNHDMNHVLGFDDWLMQKCESQPQANYCNKSKELDLLILQFVKSCHSSDYFLYIETLHTLMPWVIMLHHTHYSRNLLIHIRDLSTLEEHHPAMYAEFMNGHLMGQKSKRDSII